MFVLTVTECGESLKKESVLKKTFAWICGNGAIYDDESEKVSRCFLCDLQCEREN